MGQYFLVPLIKRRVKGKGRIGKQKEPKVLVGREATAYLERERKRRGERSRTKKAPSEK